MTRYAAQSQVTSEASRAEIERTVSRYGADGFMYSWQGQDAVVGFAINSRSVRFRLRLPDRHSDEFKTTKVRGRLRTPEASQKIYDQAVRQRWRALALVIKAKLEAVEADIVEFDQEFMAHIVMPGGSTVGEMLTEPMRAAIAGNKPLMLIDQTGVGL